MESANAKGLMRWIPSKITLSQAKAKSIIPSVKYLFVPLPRISHTPEQYKF
jgi:hypothetical protein